MQYGRDQILACPRCGAPHRCHSLSTGSNLGSIVWTDGFRHTPMLRLAPPISRCAACQRFFWVNLAVRLGAFALTEDLPDTVTVITLESAGPRPAWVIQLAHRLSDLSLEEVERRFSRLPRVLGRNLDREQTRATAARFEALGARVSLSEEARVRYPTPPGTQENVPRLHEPDEAGFWAAIAEGLAQSKEEEYRLRLRTWWVSNAPYRQSELWVPFSERPQEARDNLRALLTLCRSDAPIQRLLRAEALRELEGFEGALDVLSEPFPAPVQPAAEFIRELASQRIAEVQRLDMKAGLRRS